MKHLFVPVRMRSAWLFNFLKERTVNLFNVVKTVWIHIKSDKFCSNAKHFHKRLPIAERWIRELPRPSSSTSSVSKWTRWAELDHPGPLINSQGQEIRRAERTLDHFTLWKAAQLGENMDWDKTGSFLSDHFRTCTGYRYFIVPLWSCFLILEQNRVQLLHFVNSVKCIVLWWKRTQQKTDGMAVSISRKLVFATCLPSFS